MIGLALIIAGAVGLILFRIDLGQRLGEAVLIAGILTIAVDPFLKKRLLREASVDIFHHLLGFGLPDEIKARLRDIVLNTGIYRKNMLIIAAFNLEGNKMRIDFENHYEIINPSDKPVKFRQILDFEKGENPELHSDIYVCLAVSLTRTWQAGNGARRLHGRHVQGGIIQSAGQQVKPEPFAAFWR